MQDAFHYLAIIFAALFVAKMIWLGWLFCSGQSPEPGKGEVSGWGAPDA
jgi:hypothetical protein